MKKIVLTTVVVFLGLSMAFLSACNSTRLISSWRAPEASLRSYSKVLVIGLMDAKERGLREQIEKHLVQTFANAGIQSGSSFEEYGPKAFVGLTEEESLEKVNANGYDAVFIVVLLDKSKEKTYVPGNMYYTPYYRYYGRFWPYYHTLYGRVWGQGYYSTSTNYILEANFYDLKRDELEYSAQTKSFNPSSNAQLATELSEKLLQDMFNQNIIQQ